MLIRGQHWHYYVKWHRIASSLTISKASYLKIVRYCDNMGAGSSVADGDVKAADDADVEQELEQDVEEPKEGTEHAESEEEADESQQARNGRNEIESSRLDDSRPIIPAPREVEFETTDRLLGQWNLASVEAIINCEKDFTQTKSGDDDGETDLFIPPSAVIMDHKLQALLWRISKLHEELHKAPATATLDAGSLRSGKKPRVTANPIKTLMSRISELHRHIETGLSSTACDSATSIIDPASCSGDSTCSSIVQRHWHYPSPFQQVDEVLRFGGDVCVTGFEVRLLGATDCLVAVEAIKGHGLNDVTTDALACSGIGTHPNILMLLAVQRKFIRCEDPATAKTAVALDEPAVELTWEYVKGYTLEKIILTGVIYSPAHRPSANLDSTLKR